jgi:hypothetical protein
MDSAPARARRLRAGWIGLAIIICVVCSGCHHLVYTKADIRHDALALLPPHAHVLAVNVIEGDGVNRTLSVTVSFRMPPGTTIRQRGTIYEARARRLGWKLSRDRTYWVSDRAWMNFALDVALTPRIDQVQMTMT